MTYRRHGRRKPYTEVGVRRLPCYKCGAPASQQWQVCADGNLWRPICAECDIGLNALVLEWLGHPDRTALVLRYAHKLRAALADTEESAPEATVDDALRVLADAGWDTEEPESGVYPPGVRKD